MTKTAHIIGNGPSAGFYKPAKGLKILCNLPPMSVANAYTTVMVDFKMMKAIHEGSVVVPGDWVLGARPNKWMEMRNDFYMKYAPQIKEFYMVLPKYVANYTDFNCGHMATHYTANKLKCDEIHMYGFTRNWRPVWTNMFKEFKDTQFIIHNRTTDTKLIKLSDNVEVRKGVK